MSEIFSNERLIDYFVKFETVVTGYNINDNIQNLNNLDFNNLEESPLNIEYTFSQYKLPKKDYKNTYDLDLGCIIDMLPTEHVYIKKPPNKFFSMVFVNGDGKFYYGFFFRIYEMVHEENLIYDQLKKISNNEIEVYATKYIGLVSVNPFFVSFKKLLEEIYYQSTISDHKCFKYENILNTLLYRIYLPKNPFTQVQFALNDKIYNFVNNKFHSEISLKLLFTFLSPEKVVLLIIAFMMNSVVIFFHSNMEILAPVIECFMSLLYPFCFSYSIIQNLKSTFLDYLESPMGNIIFGIYKNDFTDLNEIFSIISRSNNGNLVYCDIENNKIDINHNEDMKKSDILPIQRIKNLMENLNKMVNIYDQEKLKNSKNWSLCDMFQTKLDYEITDKTRNTHKKQKTETNLYNIKTNNTLNSPPVDQPSSFDLEVKNLIYDFNLSFLEAYDENRHFNIDTRNQDKTFDKAQFIADSKNDIKAFLDTIKDRPSFDFLIQNINHIVDIRHKSLLKKFDPSFQNLQIGINRTLREGAIMPDFDLMYDLILKALKKKKQGKPFFKLFDLKIRNTISINSPHYENLNYRQTNIFNDPVHEEMLRHEGSLPLNLIKLDFQNLHLDYKEINYLGLVYNFANSNSNHFANNNNNIHTNPNANGTNNFLSSVNNYNLTQNNNNNFNYATTSNNIYNNTSTNNNNNLNNLFNSQTQNAAQENRNLENQIFNINVGNSNENNNFLIANKNMMRDFKKLLFQHKDIVYHFFNYTSIKNRNQLKTEFTNSNNVEENNLNYRRNSIANNKVILSKEEYIRNYNKNYYNIISKNNSKLEFHISFGANIIQTVSLCEICGKPNTLWDIRKEFQFSKNKKETKTKCKYCNMLYVPYFYVIDDPGFGSEKLIFGGNNINNNNYEKNLNALKNKKSVTINTQNNNNNKSFDDKNDMQNNSISDLQNNNINNVLHPSDRMDVGSNYTRNNQNYNSNNNIGGNKLKKVEYMSFEHLLYVYVENEIQMNMEKENTLFTINRNKRFANHINFMANLLKGELKLRIENNKFLYFTVDEYIKKLFINKFNNENNFFNVNEIGNNLNQNQIKENQKKNTLTLAKLLKEIIEKKRKEAEEEKERKLQKLEGIKKKENKIKENKVLNIKFDIKDLIFDNKFKDFSKELQALTLLNGKNSNSDNILTISKEKEITNNNGIKNRNKSKSNSPKKRFTDKTANQKKFINIDNKNKINFFSSLDINMIDKNHFSLGNTIKTKNKNVGNNLRNKNKYKENNNNNENILINSNFEENKDLALNLKNLDNTLKNNLFSIPINSSNTNINMDETVKHNKVLFGINNMNNNNNNNNNSIGNMINSNINHPQTNNILMNNYNSNSNVFYESDLISSDKDKSANIGDSVSNRKNLINLKSEKNEGNYLSNNIIEIKNNNIENRENQKVNEDVNSKIQNKLNNFIIKNNNIHSHKNHKFAEKKFLNVLESYIKK